MVLVLMVMRGAANPKVYEPFFDGGSDGETNGADPIADQPMRGADHHAGNLKISHSISTPDGDRVDPLQYRDYLDVIEVADRGAWIAWLSSASDAEFHEVLVGEHREAGDSVPDDQPDRETAAKVWKIAHVQETIDAWIGLASSIESSSIESGSMDSTSHDSGPAPPTRIGVLEALRRDAMSRVIDGSVFRGADGDAMYDLIARTDSEQGFLASPVTANVVALLQQPGYYRGKTIEVVGKVALVETVPAKPNPFGVDEFQQAWIQPETGAERPIVFIFPTFDSPVDENPASLLNAVVRIRGVYLKRLAYRSSVGADLAPVLVGSLARTAEVTGDRGAKRSVRQNANASMTMAGLSLPVWLAIASLIGIGMAAWIMTSSRRSAKRLQSLRSHMPATLPASLPEVGKQSDD